MSIEALDRAVSILKTQAALADVVGVKSPSISGWRLSGCVPESRCWAIEVATNGLVTCEQLRPDVSWLRDDNGNVVGYHVRVLPFPEQRVA